MGGGDLNLKKSWHPSTLRNIERVWKAEQKHEQEQKKIEQLQRELAEERAREEMRQFAENHGVVKKKEERLDWMYQGPSALVDKEQYLMGRPIDRTFEVVQDHEQGRDKVNEALQPGALFNQSSVNVTVDLAAKVREDPLFTIKKHEVEQKKRLLDNPVKMKQIQQMLEQSMTSKSKKKKKKHRKHHNEDRKAMDNGRKHRDKKSKMGKSHKPKDRDSHKQHEDSRHGRAADIHRERSSFKSHLRENDRSTSNQRFDPPAKKRLTGEEMERRRREMMENAYWREEQRQNNVKRYKEEEQKEKERHREENGAAFIKPLISKATLHGSVEGRVKQKVYNIQRSKFDMDKNFAKR